MTKTFQLDTLRAWKLSQSANIVSPYRWKVKIQIFQLPRSIHIEHNFSLPVLKLNFSFNSSPLSKLNYFDFSTRRFARSSKADPLRKVNKEHSKSVFLAFIQLFFFFFCCCHWSAEIVEALEWRKKARRGKKGFRRMANWTPTTKIFELTPCKLWT